MGDLDIPTHSLDMPSAIKEYMVPGTINHVISTGNIGNAKTLNFIKRISSNFAMVKGSRDMVR